MAAMDMDDEEDMWANTTSPSASPPQPAFISTQLSLNSHLHLLSSATDHSGGGGDGMCGHHDVGGGGFRNAAAVCPASFFPYGLNAVPAPLDAGDVPSALEREMCGLGPAAAAWAGGTDRRKKRMIKNRESAARSRARKQAYIRELEMEVKRLQQENESLRVKYDQLRVSTEAPAPVPLPSKTKKLQRVPSASF